MTIKFQSERHEHDFRALLSKMKSKDCYHKAVAYLLTLDEVCNKHIADLFDFEKDVIKPFGTLYLPWQTGITDIINPCAAVNFAFRSRTRTASAAVSLYAADLSVAISTTVPRLK